MNNHHQIYDKNGAIIDIDSLTKCPTEIYDHNGRLIARFNSVEYIREFFEANWLSQIENMDGHPPTDYQFRILCLKAIMQDSRTSYNSFIKQHQIELEYYDSTLRPMQEIYADDDKLSSIRQQKVQEYMRPVFVRETREYLNKIINDTISRYKIQDSLYYSQNSPKKSQKTPPKSSQSPIPKQQIGNDTQPLSLAQIFQELQHIKYSYEQELISKDQFEKYQQTVEDRRQKEKTEHEKQREHDNQEHEKKREFDKQEYERKRELDKQEYERKRELDKQENEKKIQLQIQPLKDEIQRLKTDNDKLRQEIKELKAQCEILQKEKQEIQTKNDTLIKERDKLKIATTNATSEKEQLAQENLSLKKERDLILSLLHKFESPALYTAAQLISHLNSIDNNPNTVSDLIVPLNTSIRDIEKEFSKMNKNVYSEAYINILLGYLHLERGRKKEVYNKTEALEDYTKAKQYFKNIVDTKEQLPLAHEGEIYAQIEEFNFKINEDLAPFLEAQGNEFLSKQKERQANIKQIISVATKALMDYADYLNTQCINSHYFTLIQYLLFEKTKFLIIKDVIIPFKYSIENAIRFWPYENSTSSQSIILKDITEIMLTPKNLWHPRRIIDQVTAYAEKNPIVDWIGRNNLLNQLSNRLCVFREKNGVGPQIKVAEYTLFKEFNSKVQTSAFSIPASEHSMNTIVNRK